MRKIIILIILPLVVLTGCYFNNKPAVKDVNKSEFDEIEVKAFAEKFAEFDIKRIYEIGKELDQAPMALRNRDWETAYKGYKWLLNTGFVLMRLKRKEISEQIAAAYDRNDKPEVVDKLWKAYQTACKIEFITSRLIKGKSLPKEIQEELE